MKNNRILYIHVLVATLTASALGIVALSMVPCESKDPSFDRSVHRCVTLEETIAALEQKPQPPPTVPAEQDSLMIQQYY
ncbi:MAG: hypothetical protein WCK77_07135 [Verrucomicrobiota bacterium]